MAERPILFSGEMVRAILEGRKVQTRRVVTGKSLDHVQSFAGEDRESLGQGWDGGCLKVWSTEYPDEGSTPLALPYGCPGDRLWVRETWYCDHAFAGSDGDRAEWLKMTSYRADFADDREWANTWEAEVPGWRPSIHMPRWASRLTLEVTDVRVERLLDISEADALAEGIASVRGVFATSFPHGAPLTPREAFARLWDGINGKRAPWSSSPWVWVVTFKQIAAAGGVHA